MLKCLSILNFMQVCSNKKEFFNKNFVWPKYDQQENKYELNKNMLKITPRTSNSV